MRPRSKSDQLATAFTPGGDERERVDFFWQIADYAAMIYGIIVACLIVATFLYSFRIGAEKERDVTLWVVGFLGASFVCNTMIVMAIALDTPFDFFAAFVLFWPLTLLCFEGLPNWTDTESPVPDAPNPSRSGPWRIASIFSLYLSWIFVRDNESSLTWGEIFGLSLLTWPFYLMVGQGLTRRWKRRTKPPQAE